MADELPEFYAVAGSQCAASARAAEESSEDQDGHDDEPDAVSEQVQALMVPSPIVLHDMQGVDWGEARRGAVVQLSPAAHQQVLQATRSKSRGKRGRQAQ